MMQATTTTTTTEPVPSSTTTTEAASQPIPAVEEEPVAAAPAAPEPPQPPTSGSVEDAIAQWFPDLYQQAWNVSGCESGHDPGAVSRGGGNYGLFQINRVHAADFEAVTGQPFRDGALDAYYNAQYARKLYDSEGWRPWTCRWAA